MEFIDASHEEWLDMWAELADYPLNNGDAQCPYLGAIWEYMGSTEDHHHFRHPMHPATAEPEYAYLERRRASIGWA